MDFFEDIDVGREFVIGSHRFTAEDIVRFARAYDPQRFHLSNEEAAKTHFGRLCASGWHTAAAWMKVWVVHVERRAADARARGEPQGELGPSPGFEDMQWPKPVFAGDEITFATRVVDKRVSASRPGWGIVTMRHEGRNPAGDLVFAFTGKAFVSRREAA